MFYQEDNHGSYKIGTRYLYKLESCEKEMVHSILLWTSLSYWYCKFEKSGDILYICDMMLERNFVQIFYLKYISIPL